MFWRKTAEQRSATTNTADELRARLAEAQAAADRSAAEHGDGGGTRRRSDDALA
jgi:hypothetical protein